MLIKNIKIKENINKTMTIRGIITRAKLIQKTSNNSEEKYFLKLEIRDSSDMISCVIWNNVLKCSECFIEGTLVEISGIISTYNDKFQITLGEITLINDDPRRYIPSYTREEVQHATNCLSQIISKIAEPYKSALMFITGYNTNKDLWNLFVTCPASESHHGNKLGGLIIHSINVAKNMNSILKNYTKFPSSVNALDKDYCLFIALIHDIGKLDEYEYTKGIIKRKELDIDHTVIGANKIALMNEYHKVFDFEILCKVQYSILSHHGHYGKFEPKQLHDQLLHFCDMIDSRCVEEFEKDINIKPR